MRACPNNRAAPEMGFDLVPLSDISIPLIY
jgi:hypothetical protein